MALPSINLTGIENPLEFHAGSISIPFINSKLVPLKIGDYEVPVECLVDVSGQKEIVKTKVPGKDGTVKELVGMDDYQVDVHFMVLAQNYGAAMAEVSSLVQVWQKQEAITIVCPKTDAYGISKVVFESFTHPHLSGKQGEQRLTLKFSSDETFEPVDLSLLNMILSAL